MRKRLPRREKLLRKTPHSRLFKSQFVNQNLTNKLRKKVKPKSRLQSKRQLQSTMTSLITNQMMSTPAKESMLGSSSAEALGKLKRTFSLSLRLVASMPAIILLTTLSKLFSTTKTSGSISTTHVRSMKSTLTSTKTLSVSGSTS